MGFLALLSIQLSGTASVAEMTSDDDISETAPITGQWRLVSDQVMGGKSTGSLRTTRFGGRECTRMQGTVTTANNGGFLQMATDLNEGNRFDASRFTGVRIVVAGNDESYNVHLRTSNLWLPWQSYRAEFYAGAEWKEFRLPFTSFEAYRTRAGLDTGKLVRIGLVAIGRNFDADLCVADAEFYLDGPAR